MVKVIDFGLVKPFRAPVSERRLSEEGRFFGTPHFASPEQCLGKDVDIRSDLYSLGVTLWVMLSGQAPFDGPITEVMQKHVHEAPPVERLEHGGQAISQALAEFLHRGQTGGIPVEEASAAF
jgi:eukaryotic-like serine/threonine-protein kinase